MRRALLLLLVALLLAVALVGWGPWRLPGPGAPPAGLLRDLQRRRRDLSRLAAAAAAQARVNLPAAASAPWPGGALGCADLAAAAALGVVGGGITKRVVRAALPAGGPELALKSVHGAGRDVSRCVQRYGHPAGCRRLAAYKLLKEAALLRHLQHPGIVKLHGQCYDLSADPENQITTILELGTPLEMIHLLQTPWEKRFKFEEFRLELFMVIFLLTTKNNPVPSAKLTTSLFIDEQVEKHRCQHRSLRDCTAPHSSIICLDLVELLHYLANSPLGSIALLDFQPRQFVMVNGLLKVTDLDDVSTEELPCRTDEECVLEFPMRNFSLRCTVRGRCEGINERRNLFNAYRYFFTYLLPHTAPVVLQPILKDILNATGDLRYGANETLRAFQKVLHLYKSGLYLPKKPSRLKEYIALKGFRSGTAADYKCWPSYSHLGCLLSVHNAEEAADICSSHLQCQHFIITPQKTWAGRPLALFQSSLANLIQGGNMVVYVKRPALSEEKPLTRSLNDYTNVGEEILIRTNFSTPER